jgi:hypothetical protein
MTKTERSSYSKFLNISEDASIDDIVTGYRLKLLQLKLGKNETNNLNIGLYNAFRMLLRQFNIEDIYLTRIANEILNYIDINISLYNEDESKLIQHFINELLNISKDHEKCVRYNSFENIIHTRCLGLKFKSLLNDLNNKLESYLHEKEVDVEELLEIINQQMHNEKLFKEFSNDGNHIKRKTNTYGEYVSFVGNKVLALGKLIFEIRNILSQNK